MNFVVQCLLKQQIRVVAKFILITEVEDLNRALASSAERKF